MQAPQKKNIEGSEHRVDRIEMHMFGKVNQEMQIKTMRCHFLPDSKDWWYLVLSKGVGKQSFSHTVDEIINWMYSFKKAMSLYSLTAVSVLETSPNNDMHAKKYV